MVMIKRLTLLIAALTAASSVCGGQADPVQLQIWNDPDFQKRFAESYIAETDIEPRVTEDEREIMLEVLELIAADQLPQAASLLRKNLGPEVSAVFDFTLANIHFQDEQLDSAAAAYQTAVDKYPKFRRAWKNLGLIHARQSRFDQAATALTRVIALGGSDALTYGLLAFSYANLENNISAESAYRMAILLDPDTMDWKMGLARSLFRQERYADAGALCSQLIAADASRADLWMLQANAYIGLNQPLKAAENYEIIDGMGQSTPESLNMLADIYVNQELFETAVNTYIRALEAHASAGADRAIRAARVMTAHGALSETKRLVEGIELLRADQLQPDDRKGLMKLRARLAVAEGAGDEEAAVLEDIIALDPLDGEALMLLGQYHERTGDREQAVFYYERASSLEQFEADAKVRHAQLLVRDLKYEEALPLLRRAQTLKPRDNIQQYLEQVERVSRTN